MSAVDRPTSCGPDAVWTMEHMTAADMARFLAPAAELRGITRPSGDPAHARHADQGITVGWSPRQQAAARRLEDLFRSGRRGFTGPAGYRTGAHGGPASYSDEEIEQAGNDWAAFTLAAQIVEQECSVVHVRALRLAVIDHQPSPRERADLVREALAFLADWWKLS